MATSKEIANLVINKVESQAVYNYMVDNNLINDDELYFVETTGESLIELDNTLSIEGMAADAKAVGDALSTKADSADLFDTGMTDTVTWDGNTEGIESVNDFLFKICDISDETATEIANGSADLVVTAIDESGNSHTMGCSQAEADASIWNATDSGNYTVLVVGSVMAPQIGVSSSGIWCIMSNGVFLSSITFEGIDLVEKKVIKEELIPKKELVLTPDDLPPIGYYKVYPYVDGYLYRISTYAAEDRLTQVELKEMFESGKNIYVVSTANYIIPTQISPEIISNGVTYGRIIYFSHNTLGAGEWKTKYTAEYTAE